MGNVLFLCQNVDLRSEDDCLQKEGNQRNIEVSWLKTTIEVREQERHFEFCRPMHENPRCRPLKAMKKQNCKVIW